MSDIAIRVEHLSKKYRLGVINNGTLFKDIQTWMALKRGKEDPHSKIGQNKYPTTEDFFWALKDISLDIKLGDRVGIIGKNGAGKSTLLKLLSRITSPTEGSIKIRGKIASLLEVGTGFHGELTGRENIYLNGAILGMKKRRIDQKIDEIIAFSGIEEHIDTPVKRYSSGMYVRLAFAVAAHLDSDILIADEVLAVGDAEFQKKALGKMQDLSTGQGRTVLFVSHNMNAVERLCNCGIILERGRIRSESKDIKILSSEYLTDFKQRGSTKWINNDNLFDPYFTPISIELQEENGSPVTGAISAGNNYRIKLTFKVDELNNNMSYAFSFTDSSGIVLFNTDPTFTNDYKPHLGQNTVYCYIPRDFLNINTYYLSLYSLIQGGDWIIEPSDNITIVLNVTQKSFSFITANKNLISPLVQWTVE